MKIKACIFDMDGTLVNSIMDIAFSMNSALSNLGYNKIELNKFNTLVGRGFDKFVIDTLKLLSLEYNNPNLQDKLYKEFVKEYNKNLSSRTQPYENIKTLLENMNKLKIPIGILSNKNHEELINLVKNIFGNIFFFEIRGYSKKFPPKPDPENALDMILELNVQKEEIAYIGDSDVDMLTALNAGFIPIGVSWGFRSVQELKQNGAKHIIHKPLELLDLIK
ncbi:HAD family hydrolase [Borreliella tanukii]|uniref:HAD family hydrolase n=1 Tax=Borreliella tanukii TaxID=56146 RepID=UPI0026488A79|nr:HAD family hydrolase [Borreliella tanukii]WKC80043.1 HAD family hydrolase [Borreliella tanukii]WKC81880.1 HAD family hydrolase [Borreliella tanukii]WKC82796.1 HAD family hydrolase [Borreliella tanukii]